MRPLAFWKTIVADDSDFLERVIARLVQGRIRYCVVGGQAVNAYVEPLVSLDLDLALSAGDIGAIEALFAGSFAVHRFPHSINVAAPDSALRVQFQTDPRYAEFVDRASVKDVLGVKLPVATLVDVFQGKIWAVTDTSRRASKRQKDLADIARILEAHPHLRDRVPPEILSKLV